MNKFELAKLKSHIDKLAQENYLKASKLDNVDSKTANNFYWRADGIRNVLNEIEKLGLVSEDGDWVNLNNEKPPLDIPVLLCSNDEYEDIIIATLRNRNYLSDKPQFHYMLDNVLLDEDEFFEIQPSHSYDTLNVVLLSDVNYWQYLPKRP